MEIIITKSNFNDEVLNSNIPVIVDFWATWCGPCKMLAPVIEEISEELYGKVKVGKINVDEEGELASMFGITSIPTVMLFENGKVTASSLGYRTKEQLLSALKLV